MNFAFWNEWTFVQVDNVRHPPLGIDTPPRAVSVIEQMAERCSESEDDVATRAPDRRVQRTEELLRGALMSLIRERGFEELSVQDIIDRANVGRATFYAHFDNKDDLLASGIEGLRASLKERQRAAKARSTAAGERLLAFSEELFTHANEHRDVFRAMLGRRSGVVVQRLLHKMLVDLVRDEVNAMNAPQDSGGTSEVVAQFVGGGLFGLLVWWSTGKMRISVADVNAQFRQLAMPALSASSNRNVTA